MLWSDWIVLLPVDLLLVLVLRGLLLLLLLLRLGLVGLLKVSLAAWWWCHRSLHCRGDALLPCKQVRLCIVKRLVCQPGGLVCVA